MPSLIQRLFSGGPAVAPAIAPAAQGQGPSSDLPYSDYGYIPGVAQTAQATVPPNPFLNPQPYFNTEQLSHALWFTTRVHLSPLGKA